MLRLQEKTDAELLVLEKELSESDDEFVYGKLIALYKERCKRLRQQGKRNDDEEAKGITKRLVRTLVEHGTYLKTVYQKNDALAKSSLQEALRYEKNNPIAHYRLGFLAYRKCNYSEALNHFQQAMFLQRGYTGRRELLDAAEALHTVQREWLDEGSEFIRLQLFYHVLEQALSISGASGNEGRIRAFVYERLRPFADHITVDRSGNILAQKTYRGGHGPVVLLNAHLDTAEEFVPGRVIEKNGATWSSSEGILGEDDRAGVAVLLEVARYLENSSFSGTVKFIFTVEEESGLTGSRKVDDYFLWDVDAAIVVDRRGTGDIVTSCGGFESFCSKKYGRFFEQVAADTGLEGWRCTAGGSSDTRIWTMHGIQSVNVSVGYQHEHTDAEILDVEACYRTVKLVCGAFRQGRELQGVLREIRRGSQAQLHE